MHMNFDMDNETGRVINIKVVGVGGGGGNAVNHMVVSEVQGVEFISLNTDRQALMKSKATVKTVIGEKTCKGGGAGGNPDVGQRAGEESRDEIMAALKGAQMVFVTAGMGGGTGTGSAAIVAEVSREMGALTVGVVTKPFAFEGKRRMEQAESGILALRDHVDALIVIPNERLKEVSETKITLMNAFAQADDVLRHGVQSISDLINIEGFINLDFADVTAIMKDAGYAHMGVGHAAGKGKAEDAARAAISSPLMETSINGARGVLVNITGSMDIGLEDVEAAAGLIQQAAHPDANIIFGANFDESMDDEIRVTVVATRFDEGPVSHVSAPVAEPEKTTGMFTEAVEKKEAEVKTEANTAADDDPFDTIFKIFNSK